MSQNAEKGVPCCAPPLGQRMLRFPDGSQCGVVGLDDILVWCYKNGFTTSDLFQNGINVLCPNEWLWIRVVHSDVLFNG